MTLADTVQSRQAIGFAEDKADWNHNRAVFDEHTLKISGHPVMEDWETGYMRRLAEIATSGGGHVLEVGFGMGISASFIQQATRLSGHTVIECHPDVIRHALCQFPDEIASSRLHLLSGFWEDVVPLLGEASFDGVLFDTYPLVEAEIHRNHFPFFRAAHRLLKPGGVLTYYSDEVNGFTTEHLAQLSEAGFKHIDYEVIPVEPPADCEYWRSATIVAPIVRR